MDDGSGDGDDEGEKPNRKLGKLLVLPGGNKVSPKDIGAGYVVGQTGDVPTPDVVDPVEVTKDVRERLAYVRDQDLVKLLRDRSTTSEVIDAVLLEIAEEISHLKWDRRRATLDGKSTANLTVSRVASLRSLTELLLKRKEAAMAERLDLKSPRFQAVFAVWMDFFYSAMEKSGVEGNVIDLVFNQMKADMVGWEKKMDLAGVETVLLWIGFGSVLSWIDGPSTVMSILSQVAATLA